MLATTVGFMGCCEERVRTHMCKMVGEWWNGWFVFGDIRLYFPPPVGSTGSCLSNNHSSSFLMEPSFFFFTDLASMT